MPSNDRHDTNITNITLPVSALTITGIVSKKKNSHSKWSIRFKFNCLTFEIANNVYRN